jgi:DNA-binding transcriptional regulator LsrR (DeoR family)
MTGTGQDLRGSGEEAVSDEELSDAERATLESGDDVALRIAVARRYYLGDQAKVTIGKAFGLSRFQVARMLQDARRDGLVRIEIGAPGRLDRELSAALQEKLGLPKVVVVASKPSTPHATLEHVGRALAEEVAATVREGSVVGLAWSAAIAVMAQSLDRLPRCTVVQLAGALYPPAGVPGSVDVSRLVAQAAGGDAHTIYAPLVVTDADTAAGLRRQPEIADVLGRGRSLDLAVVSVGAWRPSASAVYDLLPAEERTAVAGAGACGEVSARLFDAAGRLVRTPLDDRVIGVAATQLKRVPHLITSSVGAFRAEATLAAVRAGLAHTLVVDEDLAAALLRA